MRWPCSTKCSRMRVLASHELISDENSARPRIAAETMTVSWRRKPVRRRKSRNIKSGLRENEVERALLLVADSEAHVVRGAQIERGMQFAQRLHAAFARFARHQAQRRTGQRLAQFDIVRAHRKQRAFAGMQDIAGKDGHAVVPGFAQG